MTVDGYRPYGLCPHGFVCAACTADDRADVRIMIAWGLRHAENPAVAEILARAAVELARLELEGKIHARI